MAVTMVFGLLLLLFILGLEYLFWLNSISRLALLIVGLIGLSYLLYNYVIVPLFYLFRLRRGISHKDASLIIGKHFPEVDDRLYNLLDLSEDNNTSELLKASIDQRSVELGSFTFTQAVNLNDSLKFGKYLLLPLLVVLFIWISGQFSSFFSSYERVVHYKMAYEPPAPFSFQLLSTDLEVLAGEPVIIRSTTVGDIQPEEMVLVMDGKDIVMGRSSTGWQYTFVPNVGNTSFYFKANGYYSKEFVLSTLSIPLVQDFKMVLEYPSYTGRNSEVLNSTGSAEILEGTKVSWSLQTSNTEEVAMLVKDSVISMGKDGNVFSYQDKVYSDFKYALSTSNNSVKEYEKLEYELKVIKDAYPKITMEETVDSLTSNVKYYSGKASDDYKIRNIDIVYGKRYADDKTILNLVESNSNVEEFYYTFPSGLDLEEGEEYEYYFVVTDNDGIHGGKHTKSTIFSTQVLTQIEVRNKDLESQNALIKNIDASKNEFKKQELNLHAIKNLQREKEYLNFNDQNKVKDFLQKQERQEKLMEKFSKELKENLEKSNKDDKLNKLLQERLERQEIEAKKNAKLLEELNKVADKLSKVDLAKKLDEVGKNQKNNQRNLEQLLELTKRYYVTEKLSQLASELDHLSKEQEKAAKDSSIESSKEQQKEVSDKFNKLKDELKELQEDNNKLQKPMDIEANEKLQESISNDQQQASEALFNEDNKNGDKNGSKDENSGSSKKQKSASDKMQELSNSLQQSASGDGMETITEDAEMLRQILDNLIIFSFKQEKMLDDFKEGDAEAVTFSRRMKEQKELRELFTHVDDSLFALSLRREEISETINKEITEVYYNIDKALENLADNKIYQGVSNQQHVLTASNTLADFLADILDNMQASMKSGNGQGQGQGNGFQLPDIIQGQGGVSYKMNGQGGEGKEGSKGKSGQGKQGEGGQKGDASGSKGTQSGEGSGENGNGSSQNSNGNNGSGEGESGGSGSGVSESDMAEIYEIYKQQEQIKQALEKQLADMQNAADKNLAKKLLQQMEDFQDNLLEQGITKQTQMQANNIEHQLLKLENAAREQGEKRERESNTSMQQFTNPITTKPDILLNKKTEVEILNRQALPLRQNYRVKIKNYFNNND